MEIRTRGGRLKFAPSEPVEYEEIYTSKFSGLWHIEVLDAKNQAGNTEVVHISDGKTVVDEPSRFGIICCFSRHVWLSLDPTRLPYRVSIGEQAGSNPERYVLHLPDRPGKYEVYVTTEKVFRRSDSTFTPSGRGMKVSSNLLELEVR